MTNIAAEISDWIPIEGTTRILGIFGDPVAHSFSPLMQNSALKKLGINAFYVPFRVEEGDLGDAVQAIRALKMLGVNVTVPHKERVCPFLDQIDPDARLIGAVNTVVNRKGVLTGYNTDGLGLLRSLRDDLGFDPAGKNVLLLGAGGACRAAVVALLRAGVSRLVIANRTEERARGLVDEYQPRFPGVQLRSVPLDTEPLRKALAEAELLINGTSRGLEANSWADFPFDALPPGACAYDMLYGEKSRAFLDGVTAVGLRGCDGLGMLAGQGEAALELWTGRQIEPGFMKRVLDSRR